MVPDVFDHYSRQQGLLKAVDLSQMPDLNVATGSHGLGSVSSRAVKWHWLFGAVCHLHGAMNSVAPDGRIWRCLTCHEALYLENN